MVFNPPPNTSVHSMLQCGCSRCLWECWARTQWHLWPYYEAISKPPISHHKCIIPSMLCLYSDPRIHNLVPKSCRLNGDLCSRCGNLANNDDDLDSAYTFFPLFQPSSLNHHSNLLLVFSPHIGQPVCDPSYTTPLITTLSPSFPALLHSSPLSPMPTALEQRKSPWNFRCSALSPQRFSVPWALCSSFNWGLPAAHPPLLEWAGEGPIRSYKPWHSSMATTILSTPEFPHN